MCRILILADIRPISFHAVVVFGLGKNLLFKSILGRCVISLTLKSRNKMAAERLKAHKQLSRYRKREGNEYFSFSCLYCKLSIFSSKMHQLILSTDIKSSLTSLSMSIFYWISFRSKGCYITRYLTSLGHDKNSWKLFFSNTRFSLKCLGYSVHFYRNPCKTSCKFYESHIFIWNGPFVGETSASKNVYGVYHARKLCCCNAQCKKFLFAT